LRIWSAGCATGEEAYSLALLIADHLGPDFPEWNIKIFATDIDANALDVASRAVYPETVEKDIPEDLLKEYFTKDGSKYTVSPRIRKQIVFAKHNITKDPPFIKNDLATCRNMLIYMNSVLQRKVMTTLHFSLNPDGFLFLGPSESASSLKENLIEINNKWKVYRRNGSARIKSPDNLFRPMEILRGKKENRDLAVQFSSPSLRQLSDEFRDVLAEEFGFAAFYIDSNYEIKESLGDFRKYLGLPEKKLQLNILKMVPPELSVALNTAIRKALQDQRKVHVKGVRVKEKSKERYITLTVRPGNPFLLVVLGEVRKENFEAKAAVDYSSQDTEANKYIMELEAELKQTRGELQMAIEGLETANEELQSSNEELLSANEELQSSNEELQSLNEELHTLNTEHQLKIKELIEPVAWKRCETVNAAELESLQTILSNWKS